MLQVLWAGGVRVHDEIVQRCGMDLDRMVGRWSRNGKN